MAFNKDGTESGQNKGPAMELKALKTGSCRTESGS